ncbi:MAG: HRDC domain-containing protein, partial [Bacteroidales bacterium]|nr:HRDC domain-containing protein [Candidatus Cacconaster equifaecalis]
ETVLFYNVQDLIMLRKFALESGQQDINIEKLKRMQEYAEAQVCRRRILLNYFGETSTCNCGNCDVCKNPPQHFDGTSIVQKALSAIRRAGEQAGFSLATDILRGNHSPLIMAKGFDKLRTFGVGRDIPDADWRAYLLQMLQLGYIEIAYDEYNHLKVTPLGEDVLYGRKDAQLSVIVKESLIAAKRKPENPQSVPEEEPQSEDQVLFEKLRELRRTIANEMHKPAYIVLSDKSLHSLASLKPTSLSQFGNAFGIGEYKKSQFGDKFVNLICSHLGITDVVEMSAELPMGPDGSGKKFSYMEMQKQAHPNAYAPWTDEEEKTLLFLWRQGKSISELAEILQRNTGSIRSRLKKKGSV